MKTLLRILVVFVCASLAFAAGPEIESAWAPQDVQLDTIPTSSFWRGSKPIYVEQDTHGHVVPSHRGEVRARWTDKNLYFLFICPYRELNLKPNPSTSTETYQLWDWDVAEVFIGSNFENIQLYKEFEVSPQGEWIDLDIDLRKPHHEEGWTWNSGFEVSARIDRKANVWYGAMRIPYSAIDTRPAAPGNTLRVNFFRSQGPASHRMEAAWQSPMSNTFHVPERFGLLKLVKKEK